jgi:hypothetical protein
MRPLTRAQLEEFRDRLVELRRRITEDELEASSTMTHRIEGAIVGLSAALGEQPADLRQLLEP